MKNINIVTDRYFYNLANKIIANILRGAGLDLAEGVGVGKTLREILPSAFEKSKAKTK